MSDATPMEEFRQRSMRLAERPVVRALQLATLLGCLLGVILFARHATHEDAADARRGVVEWSETAEIRLRALDAEIAALLVRARPMATMDLAADASPATRLAARGALKDLLAGAPADALIVFEDGRVRAVYGDAPGAAGPTPTLSQQTGTIEKQVSHVRRPGSDHVLRYDAAPMGDGVRLAAAVNEATYRDVLARRGYAAALSNSEGAPLAGDVRDVPRGVIEHVTLQNGALNLSVAAPIPRPIEALSSRQWDMLFLFGPGALALLVTLSVIQNEWRRQDRKIADYAAATARAETAANLVSAGVIDWDVSDGVLTFSKGWSTLFDDGAATPDDEIYNWIHRVHPDDRARVREAYQALSEGRVDEISHRFRAKNAVGEWVPIFERGRPSETLAGRVERVVLLQTRDEASEHEAQAVA